MTNPLLAASVTVKTLSSPLFQSIRACSMSPGSLQPCMHWTAMFLKTNSAEDKISFGPTPDKHDHLLWLHSLQELHHLIPLPLILTIYENLRDGVKSYSIAPLVNMSAPSLINFPVFSLSKSDSSRQHLFRSNWFIKN